MINSTTNSTGQAQLKSIANHGMTFMIILKEPDLVIRSKFENVGMAPVKVVAL